MWRDFESWLKHAMGVTRTEFRNLRRSFIGGSDARIIMGSDEAALIRLWQEKRGEVEPQDLSGNLIVQLGSRPRSSIGAGTRPTPVRSLPMSRSRFGIRHFGGWRRPWTAGFESSGAVFEAKFMLPWSFSEEAAAEKYMPQLQHNMWVVARATAVLSVITGGGKWVEINIHADPLYQHLIVTAERKFWRCVESGEPPRLFGVEPPKPRIEAVRIVDMSASNAWAEFAGIFARTRAALSRARGGQDRAQGLMPEDAKEAIGHGVRAKRSKSGAVSFDLLSGRAAMQRSSEIDCRLAAALAKAQAELTNPEKSLVATIQPDRDGEARAIVSLCPAVERARHRAQDPGPA